MTSAELWSTVKNEISEQIADEPVLVSFLSQRILSHDSLEAAISDLLASKLGNEEVSANTLSTLFNQVLREDPGIAVSISRDLQATCERDPAVNFYGTALLYFKGFQSLQAYRMAHHLWQQGRRSLALYLQSRISEVFTVDIHPAANIGAGILVDHATGIVIGETSVLADNISIMQGVTLGGTGKECGDRHPKIHAGVLIGAGANIIGNVTIGEGAKVGAGSVVLKDVAPHTTVAGVPAIVVGRPRGDQPALDMSHDLNMND